MILTEQQQQFETILQKYNMEAIPLRDTLMLICPRLPPKEVMEQLRSIVPPDQFSEVKIVESLKTTTTEAITRLLSPHTDPFSPMLKGRHLKLELSGHSPTLSPESTLWSILGRVLSADPYLEGFQIICNGEEIQTFNRKVSLEIAAHPVGKIITKDEILNLSIELGKANTVEEFLNAI
jgi:hypothetical protein